MDWHTTGGREELLIIMQGQVIVQTRRGRSRRIALAAGRTLFIPPQTAHRVVNAQRAPARYIYVTG